MTNLSGVQKRFLNHAPLTLPPHLPDVDSEVFLLYDGGVAITISREHRHGVVGSSCQDQPLRVLGETGFPRVHRA